MKNILITILLLGSFASFAIPNEFKELFQEGYWTGESISYIKGNAHRAFYATKAEGNTFNTLVPPGEDEASFKYQKYSLNEEGLTYNLRFGSNVIAGTLHNFDSPSEHIWEFSQGPYTHRFTRISDSEMTMETFMNAKKHAEVRLTFQGNSFYTPLFVLYAKHQYEGQ